MPLEKGSRLGTYQIVGPLGAGGMGEVYRARDLRLGREVALKVLPQEFARDRDRLARFEREARMAAALNHPNIVILHSVEDDGGVRFLTMELVEGERLDRLVTAGGLPVDRVLDLGIALADALGAAHARGVVHRDLKPENVMVTRDGRVKVLDFGLAKIGEIERGIQTQAATVTSALSDTGQVVGTAPYMSPEQIRGDAVDTRTDLFSLGTLLYELAAGRRPFTGATWAVVTSSILRDAPPPLASVRSDLPSELDRILARCLAKEPRDRYPNALEVGSDLRQLRAAREATPQAAAHGKRSLAVLPLENVSRDPAQEYFADGMTEALITELARLKALRVISRTSAMKYKGVHRSLPEIARELSVDAILEGSVLLIGDRVRVSVQLVAAGADETQWADRYDGDLADVLDLQSRIAEKVAREIEVQVSPREVTQLARHRPVNPEAHVEFLKGQHTMDQTSPQAVELSLRHFHRALEFDPTHAQAWAGISQCHMIRGSRGMAPPAEANAAARSAAQRALELDDTMAHAHAMLGWLAERELDFRKAVPHLQRALELDPGLILAYRVLGSLYYCYERHREAEEAVMKALSLDPLSMIIHTVVGDTCYYSRQYERSLVYYRKAIELDPRFDGAHTDLARSLEALGRFDEARREYEEGRKLSGGVAGPSFGLAHLEARSGNIAVAREMLRELTAARSHRVVSAWGIAVLHASLGDVDDAFRWLETAIDEHATGLIFLRVHPRLDPIRSDPRYHELLERLGFLSV